MAVHSPGQQKIQNNKPLRYLVMLGWCRCHWEIVVQKPKTFHIRYVRIDAFEFILIFNTLARPIFQCVCVCEVSKFKRMWNCEFTLWNVNDCVGLPLSKCLLAKFRQNMCMESFNIEFNKSFSAPKLPTPEKRTRERAKETWKPKSNILRESAK